MNRRSRPEIVDVANGFAQSIAGRLTKEMGKHREDAGPAVSIAIGHTDEHTEAEAIADLIERLHEGQGLPYREIAILVRGRTAYPRSLTRWRRGGSRPARRTHGLFEQREAAIFGATFAWLADIDWAPGRFIKREIELMVLIAEYLERSGIRRRRFVLDQSELIALSHDVSQADTVQDPPDGLT